MLLILAGITIQFTIGQQGILRRAEEAGKNYIQAAKQEENDLDKLYSSIKIADGSQITLTMEELNQYIQEKVEEVTKKQSETTVLFEGNTDVEDVTFLNGHTVDEFDKIRFIYGFKGEEGWTRSRRKRI